MKSFRNILHSYFFTMVICLIVISVFIPTPTFALEKFPSRGLLPLGTIVTDDAALFDVNSDLSDASVNSASAGLVSKVAPGEILPISIKLSNFGGGKRVDVILNYEILNSNGDEIYETSETVAVETTASFIKTVQIPFGTIPGVYKAKTYITYQGQLVPASTQFPFLVERKILGLFQSDFTLYAGVTFVISILVALLSYAFIRRRRTMRFIAFDYSSIPREKRIFYELTSDTIAQMRQRVGDEALTIALHIEGLKIDEESGKVLALERPPAKIIADLVSNYENLLGKKVSFSFRKEEENFTSAINLMK